MTEDERLGVQNSVNLSITLISFAVTLIGGTVAGFLTIGDKLAPCWSVGLLLVVILTVFLLTISIILGGLGIKETSKSIVKDPTKLNENYDGGNFNRQANWGLGGLLIGVVGFVGVAAVAMPSHNVTDEHLKKIGDEIQELRSKISEIQGETRTQADQVTTLLSKQRADVVPIERPALAKSPVHDLPRQSAPSKAPSSSPNN